ncbi:hypothetical protein MK394_05315 [Streptococcus sanguinis]|jgi:PREDICTED: hypothetical protein|uniref:hypothetical protein n=1 Tax=Streptococcus sanguinis TaxID=1305 RepID=UPI0022840A5C|nr:hypothetical protein [Streptococcus sanguinis]MCY7032294.1 hypothetical protein [Streptococcus sanguinis]
MKKTFQAFLLTASLLSLASCAQSQSKKPAQSSDNAKTSKKSSSSNKVSSKSSSKSNSSSSSSSSSDSSSIPSTNNSSSSTIVDGKEVSITSEGAFITFPEIGKVVKKDDGYLFASQGLWVMIRTDGQYMSITSEGRSINSIDVDPGPVNDVYSKFGISGTADIDAIIEKAKSSNN